MDVFITLLLFWSNCAGPKRPMGLVPECQPGALYACASIAKRHGARGIVLDGYGGGYGETVGIDTNPGMIAEVQKIGKEWGLSR